MAYLSVIIPLFNKEKNIVNTLTSVCNQTYTDFEVIIVNDGSTDASIKNISVINDDRIQLFSKKNEGVSIARNFGAEKAISNYIVFLDADDYWHPNHLNNLFELINAFPNHLWFASAYEKKRNKQLTTKMDSPILEKGKHWIGEVDEFFRYCFKDSLVNSSSVCFKKDFFNSLNGFDAFTTHTEDIDLWIRAALKSPLVFSNKITARHNLDASNRSSIKQLQERNYIDFDKFIKDENKNSSLKKYLDLNRYSLAIIYKLHGDTHSFKNIISNVEIKNLNKKQQFLLKQHRYILRLLFVFQELLEKLGFRLSSF
ncbi:MAG: glycosyltransferase family 2 protein [Flavobacteriales bacterium]|jgi:glycosyltransferase involved in cell wall biosynthesis